MEACYNIKILTPFGVIKNEDIQLQKRNLFLLIEEALKKLEFLKYFSLFSIKILYDKKGFKKCKIKLKSKYQDIYNDYIVEIIDYQEALNKN